MEASPIPASLRATLEEHTAGGYLYVRTTAGGDVEQYMSFDNEISYLAIVTKTKRLLRALEDMDRDTFYSKISGHEQYEYEEDEEEEEEEEDDE